MNIDPDALRSRRQRLGLTTYMLAEVSGVSRPRISELEGGPVGVRPPTAKALADALDCDIVDITDLEPQPAAL